MVLKVQVKNILLCTSDKANKHFLTTKCHIDCLLKTEQQKPVELVIQEIHKNNMKIEEAYQLNQVMIVQLFLSKLEVFICDMEEVLNNRDINLVKKRYFLLPSNLSLSMKQYLALTNKYKYYNKTRLNINVEKQLFQLSLVDVNLVMNVIHN